MRRLLRILAALVVAVCLLPAVAGAVDIKEVTTPLGIKAWLVQDKSASAVSLAFSFSFRRPRSWESMLRSSASRRSNRVSSRL